ncbi:MAG: TolC family protein [Candidatus Omnitrophota bacterium]
MNRIIKALAVSFLILGCGAGYAAQEDLRAEPLTLSECYDLALKQSELIAINADLIKETEAHFLQALSIMLPHVSFISTDSQEQEPEDKGTTFSTLKPTKSSSRRLNVTETLFSGFKAFAAMKGSGYEKEQRTKEKERAEQLLMVDVANAFYLLMEEREDIKALLNIKKALINRIIELRKREDLGRSRPSEVVNAKTQLYSVDATIDVVKSQEIVARQLLEFLVGRSVGRVADPYDIPSSLMPEEYYVARYIVRPDVEAARYAWQYAEKAADVVDSDFLPTVSVEGNYYTQRTAFNKGTDWDVMLTLDVPIFEGTEVLGRSKEAALKAHESSLEFARLKRKTPYDIKDAYVKLKTAMTVHDTLRKAFATAKLNYYLQRKDYERSLVNNLDVLTAIQTLEDAQRNYIHALYEAKRLYWQLLVAAGENIKEGPHDTF